MIFLRGLASSVSAASSFKTVLVYSLTVASAIQNVNAHSFIPLIDFTKFRAATSLSEKRDIADAIVSAFKQSGFIYLASHGISPTTVKAVFTKVRLIVQARLLWQTSL